MNYSELKFWYDFEFLQQGIISDKVMHSGEKGSIDSALQQLGPEDALRARRKFRKLARKFAKGRKKWGEMNRKQKRRIVSNGMWGLVYDKNEVSNYDYEDPA